MDGLWLENGPFRLSGPQGSETITVNPHSWHRGDFHVVYVDQPVGTGLSFSKNSNWARNDAEINRKFYGWLVNFLNIHNYLLASSGNESVEVYFSGESHAGHYIPSMVNYILSMNKSSPFKVNVVGAAIGNGWFDPPRQYAVTEFAISKGMIGVQEGRYFDSLEVKCKENIEKGEGERKNGLVPRM